MSWRGNKDSSSYQGLAVSLNRSFSNIFNHPQYGLPNATILVNNFGSITNTVNTTTPVSPVGAGTPRQIQFALRVAF